MFDRGTIVTEEDERMEKEKRAIRRKERQKEEEEVCFYGILSLFLFNYLLILMDVSLYLILYLDGKGA